MSERAYYIRDPSELQFVARARADELGMSRLAIDWHAKLQSGYASKVLTEPPIRNFTLRTAIKILRSLGLALVVVEDPEALKAVQKVIGTRDEAYVRGRHRVDQPAHEASP